MPIVPRVDLDGPQLAGWTPRATPTAEHRLREDADAAVPLPDGVVLRADVLRPQEPGRFPALVSWSAYPRYIQTSGAPAFNNEAGVVGFTVARGYAHVILSARGITGSGGEYDPWLSPQEQRDKADPIAGGAGHPRGAGNVGGTGGSHLGGGRTGGARWRGPQTNPGATATSG